MGAGAVFNTRVRGILYSDPTAAPAHHGTARGMGSSPRSYGVGTCGPGCAGSADAERRAILTISFFETRHRSIATHQTVHIRQAQQHKAPSGHPALRLLAHTRQVSCTCPRGARARVVGRQPKWGTQRHRNLELQCCLKSKFFKTPIQR